MRKRQMPDTMLTNPHSPFPNIILKTAPARFVLAIEHFVPDPSSNIEPETKDPEKKYT